MDQTKEPCKITSLIEDLLVWIKDTTRFNEGHDAYDEWAHARIQSTIEIYKILDKYK